MKKRKFNFSGILAFVLAVLILAILVPLNIISNYFDKSFDMTPSSIYTLSDTTKNLLKETKDKKIDLYFFSKRQYLREYAPFLPLEHTFAQVEKYDNVIIHEVVPDENPDIIASLDPNNQFNIEDGDIIVKCGDTLKKVEYEAVFPYEETVFANGENAEITVYAGEELIAGAIRIVTNGTLPKVYFLTGHGENTINDSYATYAEILKSTNNYEAAELDLNQADAVPEDAAIVFIAGPKTDISDSETDKLLSYADKGGAMAFFMAPIEDNIRFTNIEKILIKYDIDMQYNIVEETNPNNLLSSTSIQNSMAQEESDTADIPSDPRTFMVDYTPTTDSFTEDLTSDIISLVEDEGLIGGISNTRTFTGIASTSSFIEKSPIIQTVYNQDEILGVGGYSAISVPYGGDEDTAKYAESLNGTYGSALYPGFYSYNKQNGSKVIAIGTTDVLDMNSMSPSIMMSYQLVQNSLIWLFDSNYDMNIGTKSASFDYMSFPSDKEATSALRIFVIVPICIAVVGLLVWLKRRHS